jgi:hypothetical protein
VVIAVTATAPGMRRLEAVLEVLADTRDITSVTAAVLGGGRMKRSRAAVTGGGSLGQLTRSLDAGGGLLKVPADRDLHLHGLTTAALPRTLLDAASHVLDRLSTAAGVSFVDPDHGVR